MALQFQGHRHLDDVIARLEKRYGKAGGKTPQPSEAHFKKNQPPKRQLNLKILQPARRQVSFQPPSVLDTGALPATVTTRRKRKRAAPAMPKLSEKEDRKRRMKKRHWYEDKFGDLRKFAKKKPRKKRSAPAKKKGRPKRAAAKRAMAKIRSRAKKKPICFNRKVTLLGLLKRIPAVKTPLAKLFR